MQSIIIDDNKMFADHLCNILNGECKTHICKGDSLSDIADDIMKELIDNKYILFINVNIKTTENAKQLQKGIELLIWFRLKGVMNHIVLYSFETLHSLLTRNSKHLVATSHGTTFVQLPSDFRQVQEALSKKQNERWFLGDLANLRKVLKPAFSIEEFRHREANWWGVKQLCDVHVFINPGLKFEQEGNGIIYYPKIINDKLLNLDNNIAAFVYGHTYKDVSTAFNHKEIELIDKNINNLKEEITEKKSKKGNVDTIGKRLYHWKVTTNNGDPKNPFYNEFLKAVMDKRNKEIEIKNLEETRKTLLISQETETSISVKNKILPNISKTKILFIDDNADNGWKDILEMIVHPAEITVYIPEQTEKDIEVLYNNLKEKLNEADLILLDLRLFDEQNRSIDLAAVSGVKLLERIRTDLKGTPVLVITASNKIWSYEYLLKLGADAFWIKEGIDNNFKSEETVENYFKLIWLIYKLTGYKYKLFNKIATEFKKIELNSELWWKKEIVWSNNDRTILVPDEIQYVNNCLDLILDKIRVYLYQSELGSLWDTEDTSGNKNGNNNLMNKMEWQLRSIFNDLGVILEIINCYDIGNSERISMTEKLCNREDWTSYLLYILRNRASHYSQSKSIEFNNLAIPATALIKWLNDHYNLSCRPTTTRLSDWHDIEMLLKNELTNTP